MIAAEERLKDTGFLSGKLWGFVVIFAFAGSSLSIWKVYDLSYAYYALIHPVWQCTQLTHYGSWIIVCTVWIIKQCFVAHSAPRCDGSAYLHFSKNRRSEKLRKYHNSLNKTTRLKPGNENSSGLCV